MGTTQDIRRALEKKAATVSGFPPATQRHWENVRFEPTTGTPWAKLVLVPATSRPANLGPSPSLRYDGTFLVVMHFVEGKGSGAADDLLDLIRAAFTVDQSATAGSTQVRFEWSERNEGVNDAPWYVVTATIKWYAYATS